MAKRRKVESRAGIRIKEREDEGSVALRISIKYQSLRFTLRGDGNAVDRVFGPLQHRLDVGRQLAFEGLVQGNAFATATHNRFGSAVTGLKELFLQHEATQDGGFVSGEADGMPLVPVRVEGCGCKTPSGELRPLLAIAGETKLQPVGFAFRSPRAMAQLEGLAGMLDAEIRKFRTSRQALAGPSVWDFITYAGCVSLAYLQLFLCIIEAGRFPDPDSQRRWLALCLDMLNSELAICWTRNQIATQ